VLKLWMIFREIISRVDPLVYWRHISDYTSGVLAPRVAAELTRP